MEILFDSQNEHYKKPFGAVKTNDNIHFSIQCSEKCELKLVLRNDSFTYNQTFDMNWSEEVPGGFKYSVDISLTSPDLYFYRFEVKLASSTLFCGKDGSRLKTGDWLPEWQLTVYDENFVTPDWMKGGIMYQIFPDRFKKSDHFQALTAANERIIHTDWNDVPYSPFDTQPYKANDFFCGNIEGIIEQLDYLSSLGINVLYLNPIFESAENHRYSTADYMNIDPYLGTNDDFVRLAEGCAGRGIRVILDGVFSHTGADSIYFNRYNHYNSIGAYNSPASKYYSWYKFTDYPDKYECWWGFEVQPNTNELNKDFLSFITGPDDSVLRFWQTKGCVGWRLDVADELPDEFLFALRNTVKAVDSEAIIIGEVWEDASNKSSYGYRRPYLLGRQLDSVMNYPFRTAIIDFVLGADALLLKDRIMSILENYPQPAIDTLMNLLSTHDTERIITNLGLTRAIENKDIPGFQLSENEYTAAKTKLKMAAFLQFTLPGVPCIYYGDEVGLQGFRDPFCRMTYPYGREDKDLLSFFTTLSTLRTSYKENFYHSFTLLYADHSVFAFKRGKIYCFVNNSEGSATISINGLSEVLFANMLPTFSETEITLPPKSYCAVSEQK